MIPCLVVGVGHPFRHDDTVGPAVAEAVAALNLDGVTVLTHHGEGTDLISRWQGFDRVVVVDATCGGGTPGTVRHWDDPAALAGIRFAKSSHVLGVAEALELAAHLGRLPRAVRVVGIEGEDFSAGTGLSPAVASAVASAVALVVDFTNI